MPDADSIRSSVLVWFERDDRLELRISASELGPYSDEVEAWARDQGYLVHRESQDLVLRKVSRLARRTTPRPANLRQRKMW